MTHAPRNIDEYLAGIPEPGRTTLVKTRAVLRSAAPPETIETLSFGMPALKYKKILVWFAAFADHCSLFPGASIVEAFAEELKGFSTSKGTIRFPLDKPLPPSLLKKLVKAKIAEIEKQKR